MNDTNALRRGLLDKFRSLTQERLVRVNNAWLSLEEYPDNPPLVAELLREVHTVKGEAKMMGFSSISVVAHQSEDLLLWARDHGFRAPKEVSRLILAGFDLIGSLLNQEQGVASQLSAERFAAQATEVLHASTGISDQVRQESPAQGGTHHAAQASSRYTERKTLYVTRQRLDQLTDLTGDLILGQGRVEGQLRYIGRMLATWRRDIIQLKPLFRLLHDRSGEEQVLLRVAELERLTHLIGQTSDELFAQRVRLQALEERVRETRLVQLSTLLSRFPRAARDLAGEQGKQVHVHIEGADVSVDSDVLDQVSEPLLHMVRNCVDHGIEAPAVRQRANKPEVGTIGLTASQRGGTVQIAVGDDGAGIDPKRVIDSALARGLLTPQQARTVSQDDLHALLFRAGFTTRSTVTDVSGRGLGLDIVREHLLRLGGSVEVETRVGRGTTFRLTIPVSMVLSRALIMRLGDQHLAVPSEAVHSAQMVSTAALTHVGDRKAVRVGEVLVPVSELAPLLRLPRVTVASGEDEAVLVLQQRDQLRAYLVDAFIGERQVVQRRLDTFCEGLRLLHGTAMLEDGALALLLNVPELMTAGMPATRARATEPLHFTGQVLVVDDSEMTRDWLVSLLQSQGWRVREAVNGADALRQAEELTPDLVITDLEMPLLDGFGLMRALGQRRKLQEVPVLVLTSRNDPQDQREAKALGARGYLLKPNADQNDLLLTLEQVMARGPRP